MNFKYFIAKRYLFAKKESKFISFITYISIFGITLGVATLVIAVSVLNGFEKEIKDKVAGLVSHIQITSFKADGLDDHHEAISKMKNSLPDIKNISPIIQREAVIKNKETVEGVVLKGIIPESDLGTARSKIVEGNFDLTPLDTTISKLLIV
jgi:lipoprotein-releasing system permease protein